MPPPIPFSPVTSFVVVGFTLAAPTWVTYLLYTDDRGRPNRRAGGSALVVLAWTAAMYAVVACDVDRPVLGHFPGRPGVYFAVPVVLGVAFRKRLARPIASQQLLIGLQLFRVIGLVFVLEWWRGVLPGVFAHPAGWGDLLAAVVAAVVLYRHRGPAVPTAAVWAVAAVGLADFASAFFFGFASSPVPFQLFAFDRPNRVDQYPTGLIPMFLVPYAVLCHVLSLTVMARQRQAARS